MGREGLGVTLLVDGWCNVWRPMMVVTNRDHGDQKSPICPVKTKQKALCYCKLHFYFYKDSD